MNLFCKYIPFIFLIGCSSNYKGNENLAEFDKEKINFIAGCSESGTLSVSVCECQFNDLVRKYDKNFYKDLMDLQGILLFFLILIGIGLLASLFFMGCKWLDLNSKN